MSDTDKQQREKKQFMETLVSDMVASYQSETSMQHLNATFLPSRQKTIEIIELLRRLVFPGFFDEPRITNENVNYHVGELLSKTHDLLYEQVHQAMCYGRNESQEAEDESCDKCCHVTLGTTEAFLTNFLNCVRYWRMMCGQHSMATRRLPQLMRIFSAIPALMRSSHTEWLTSCTS